MLVATLLKRSVAKTVDCKLPTLVIHSPRWMQSNDDACTIRFMTLCF